MSFLHHRRLNIWIVAVFALLALPLGASAQHTRQATIQANNGQDYAANELGSPWTMDDSSNFAFEYTRDNGNVTNLRIEDGKFKATSTTNDPRLTLLVPSNSILNPTIPEGGYKPIDTSVYRYLTLNLSISKTSYAMVFWQKTGTSGYEHTGFKQLTAGNNTITFDLKAGGKDSDGTWDGTVQGLYFDPTIESNVSFEIDSVLLTDVIPEAPTNIPPQLTITAPSYISGPDYATTETGNAWDMNDASDVAASRALGTVTYANGMLNASGQQDNNDCGGGLNCGDPQVTLKVGTPIDTAKYKYVTYRMKIDGKIDTINGSISRFVWWSSIPEQSTQLEAWVTYEGYRTVSGDLSKLKLLPGFFQTWAASTPKVFRFDPHEFAAAHSFHLDYVMLTGNDQAKTNAAYNIRYTTSDAEGQNVTRSFAFYLAGQPNSTQPITCAAARSSQQISLVENTIYLPLTLGKAGPPVTPSGDTCRWDTSGVAPGSYYIVVEVTDGTNTVRTTSTTPVVLSN